MQYGSALPRRRGKRTRPKAARLAPEQLDERTTERLFDEGESDEKVVHGRHFARNGDDARALRAANEDLVLNLTDSHVPLIRYEWHNQAGETMVVEAVWPFDSSPSASFRGPDIRRSGGHDSWRPRDAADHSTPEAYPRTGPHPA